jgi:hypothetical protein
MLVTRTPWLLPRKKQAALSGTNWSSAKSALEEGIWGFGCSGSHHCPWRRILLWSHATVIYGIAADDFSNNPNDFGIDINKHYMLKWLLELALW